MIIITQKIVFQHKRLPVEELIRILKIPLQREWNSGICFCFAPGKLLIGDDIAFGKHTHKTSRHSQWYLSGTNFEQILHYIDCGLNLIKVSVVCTHA